MMSISKLSRQLFCLGWMPGPGADFRAVLKEWDCGVGRGGRFLQSQCCGVKQEDQEFRVLSEVEARLGYTRFCF